MHSEGRVNEKLKHEVTGIALLALGLLLAFCFICPSAGLVTAWFSTASGVLLGYGRYLLPVWLVVRGYQRLLGRPAAGKVRRPAGRALLLLVLLAVCHLVLFAGQEWEAALQGRGGGIAGAVIVRAGKWAFGLPGLMICLLALALIGGKLCRGSEVRADGQEKGWSGWRQVRQMWSKITGYFLEDELPDGVEPVTAEEHRSGHPETGAVSRCTGAGVNMLPPLSLLRRPERKGAGGTREVARRSQLLQETMKSFGLPVKVVSVSCGPTITRYEIAPPPGVKISRIVSLADDLALALAVPAVRIEVPVPGKACLGIEVPNEQRSVVYLRELLEEEAYWQCPSLLTVALGRDMSGQPVFVDLAGLPHLLLAGSTGAGKSVCLNTMVASLLFRAGREQLRFVVVDPKKVDLAVFRDLPHLIFPVITCVRQASQALAWVMQEMERRYRLLAARGVRQIDRYNQLISEGDGEKGAGLPYIVIVIDELADLMLTAPGDMEKSICRLAQMGRAAGIHLIVATQRPSVDVITGQIKANIPARIAFAVSSQVDSRTILEQHGAEKLLGKGDMLLLSGGSSRPVRVQGAYVSDEELTALVDFWRKAERPEHQAGGKDDAELLQQAINLVASQGQASVTLLQRRLQIGYNRAVRLLETMESMGILGPDGNRRKRRVLLNPPGREQAAAGLEQNDRVGGFSE